MHELKYSDFDVAETIGVGTVGTIYRAIDKATGTEYALKLLSPAVSSDETIVARFEREILVLSKLAHPNIVGFIGEGVHEGQLFYVMEFIRGGTLKELIERCGPITWQEAAEVGRQIASALQHLHNHGIIHRDLKPGNVFVTRDGRVKLGDFGIARDLKSTDLTDAGLTVGTYSYMPPELVKGSREITGQVDLYALGCMLFELMTGRTPYPGDNFAEIFDQHLKADPPHLQRNGVACPDAINDLVLQLLAKDPHQRPFNARTVQGILGELGDVVVRPEATKGDRPAQSVRPVQITLRDRIAASQESYRPEISWKTLGIITSTITVLIVVFIWLSTQTR